MPAHFDIHLKAADLQPEALRRDVELARRALAEKEALLAKLEGRPAPKPRPAGSPRGSPRGAPAAAAPAASSPQVMELEGQVAAQGDKVRQLKAAKAPKEEVGHEVQILLKLKEKLELAKKLAAPAAPAAPPPAAGEAPSGELSKAAKKKLEKQQEKQKKKEAAAAQAAPSFTFDPAVFGPMPLINSSQQSLTQWTAVRDLCAALDGKQVTVRARIATIRGKGKLAFAVLRTTPHTVQVVLSEQKGLPHDCVKWAQGLAPESVVEVTGAVTVPGQPITGCTQQDVELVASKFFLVSASEPVLPFQLHDAARPAEGEHADSLEWAGAVQQDTRLNARWLDMRTPANHAIWTLQARVCQYFREFLTRGGYIEIHTPKIIQTASEGGATVFKLGYHGREAFLAQSPQLYKQMALMGDLNKVFEIGPVFRAENSNTHRHLCEFVGLDVELVIKEHYYEVLDVAEGLFSYIFDSLHANDAELIAVVRQQWPHTHFEHKIPQDRIDALGIGIIAGEEKRPSKDTYGALVKNRAIAMLRLSYPEGVRLLNTVLPKDEQMDPHDDLSTTNEIRLGKVVKERYGVDFYILDMFPLSVRPFYTMPHPQREGFSNSYDMFMRGEEISSGAQRVHCADLLEQRAAEMQVDLSPIRDYVNAFKLGAFPHGGFGIGMERVLMLFLGLHNIRSCSLFPRDPKRTHP